MKDKKGNIFCMGIPKEPPTLIVGKSGCGMSILSEHYTNLFYKKGYKITILNDTTNMFAEYHQNPKSH